MKIFATNVAAAAFVFYGHEELHRIRDYINDKFTKVFEPFEDIEVEIVEPLTEKLLAF